MKAWIVVAVVLAAPCLAAADGAAVRGRVLFAGKAPARARTAVHQDMAVCGTSKMDEAPLVDASGGLRNAVVSIEGAAGAAPAAISAALDQKACQFLPHVQAVPAGSTLAIGNGDGVLHNVHAFSDGATLFNLAMPQPGMQIRRKLAKPGLVRFQCDAGHTWMSAYVWAFAHPYFAVTDGAGRFGIEGVPPGTYTLRVWHEGWKKSGASQVPEPVVLTRQITVGAGAPLEVTVEVK